MPSCRRAASGTGKRPYGRSRRLLLLAAFLLALLPWPGVLWGHNPTITKSQPLNGQSVCSGDIKKITAWFTGELDVKESTITVSGPAGILVQVPDPKAKDSDAKSSGPVESAVDLNNPDRNSLVAPLNAPLAPGGYTVKWKAVDTIDKLAEEGSFSFTVRESDCGITLPFWGFMGLGATGILLLGAGIALTRKRSP